MRFPGSEELAAVLREIELEQQPNRKVDSWSIGKWLLIELILCLVLCPIAYTLGRYWPW